VTGASGLIGTALTESLSKNHNVIAMSRHRPDVDVPWVRGDFASFEDLLSLGDRVANVDVVVHLGAVTGGCKEADCLSVNVIGTRNLMRFFIDAGCRKFVAASSIAAVGMQRTDFRPLSLPMPDTHPCLDKDGYGFSKFMMEEITKYLGRQNPYIDVIDLRLASVAPDDGRPPKIGVDTVPEGSPPQWGAGRLTVMALSDAVRAFSVAAEAPYRAGHRILNATAPWAWTRDPVADVLQCWWGDEVDLSHYRRQGHEYDSLYDVSAIEQELGFRAVVE
jgi:UDP-glucose 4-epimerase